MLNLLSLGNSQRVKHRDHPLGTEQAHQVILQRNIKSGRAGIALTAGTPAQLVIDTSGLMPLRTDDHQAAGCLCFLIQLNIRTAARHVGGNRNRPVQARVRHDLCLLLMELRI